jgi:hypothetical protein
MLVPSIGKIFHNEVGVIDIPHILDETMKFSSSTTHLGAMGTDKSLPNTMGIIGHLGKRLIYTSTYF